MMAAFTESVVEEATEGEEIDRKERLKTKWAQLEEVVGSENRIKLIARELVAAVRKNVTIDWTVRDNVRAHLRVIVKRILRKYGYPPDKQEKATQTVLEQAEVLSEGWAVV
jgi:type I restriction enzyme, R subunit